MIPRNPLFLLWWYEGYLIQMVIIRYIIKNQYCAFEVTPKEGAF